MRNVSLSDRDLILSKLQQAAALTIRTLHACQHGPAMVDGAIIQPWARINLVLSGQKEATFPIAGEATRVHLQKGDVQISFPDTWELQTWTTPHELLCLVPRVSFLRVSYYCVQQEDGEPTKLYRFFHTDHPYSDGLRQTEQALLTVLEEGSIEAARLLVGTLCHLATTEVATPAQSERSQAESTYYRIRSLLETCFNEPLTRESVAEMMQLSPGYVSQLVRAQSGRTFKSLLTGIRLEHAQRLLRDTNLTVYQVGHQCGYNNAVHFVRTFRQHTGLPPGRYRNRAAKPSVE